MSTNTFIYTDYTARLWNVSTYDHQPPLIFSHDKHAISSYHCTSINSNNGSILGKTMINSSNNSINSSSGSRNGMNGRRSSSSSSSQSRNKPFVDTVTNSSFYYMDKFILLTVKASILMYSYTLHGNNNSDNNSNNGDKSSKNTCIGNRNITCSDDVNNVLNRDYNSGNYRLVHKWDLSSIAHNISATACLNSTLSPFIFCSTTNK